MALGDGFERGLRSAVAPLVVEILFQFLEQLGVVALDLTLELVPHLVLPDDCSLLVAFALVNLQEEVAV